MFNVLPFWIATKLSMLPLDIMMPVIFSSIVYWMAGLTASATKFFWYSISRFFRSFLTGFC
jgi:ATP-binding cassette subfamily G (WHITE) protein 1